MSKEIERKRMLFSNCPNRGKVVRTNFTMVLGRGESVLDYNKCDFCGCDLENSHLKEHIGDMLPGHDGVWYHPYDSRSRTTDQGHLDYDKKLMQREESAMVEERGKFEKILCAVNSLADKLYNGKEHCKDGKKT